MGIDENARSSVDQQGKVYNKIPKQISTTGTDNVIRFSEESFWEITFTKYESKRDKI